MALEFLTNIIYMHMLLAADNTFATEKYSKVIILNKAKCYELTNYIEKHL